MQYYDLGQYADALEDLGLTGRRMAEIRAEIAIDPDMKPAIRMRALRELEQLLDRNVEAGGFKHTGQAKRSVPGVGSITVSLTAVSESQRVADMFKQGLGKDSLPLYAPDMNKPSLTNEDISGAIANNMARPKEVKNETGTESETEGRPAGDGGCGPQQAATGEAVYGDGGEAVGVGAGGETATSATEGVTAEPANKFCESIGESAEGTRHRHIGHWPPSAFVPGGGITGVPKGADPFTYGQESCVSFEEARRLAKCSVNEGIAGREREPAALDRIAKETNEALHQAEKQRRDSTRGRSITSRKIGPIPMYELVQGGSEET